MIIYIVGLRSVDRLHQGCTSTIHTSQPVTVAHTLRGIAACIVTQRVTNYLLHVYLSYTMDSREHLRASTIPVWPYTVVTSITRRQDLLLHNNATRAPILPVTKDPTQKQQPKTLVRLTYHLWHTTKYWTSLGPRFRVILRHFIANFIWELVRNPNESIPTVAEVLMEVASKWAYFVHLQPLLKWYFVSWHSDAGINSIILTF